jgi:hypothetical protein
VENTEGMKRFALLGVILLAAGCGSTKTVTETQTATTTVTKTVTAGGACAGSALSATFDAIPGSQGAGNIVYALKLTNTSSTTCELSITNLQLLDASGNDVPTNITPPPSSSIGAGESVAYNARFSPDVNGTGDNTNGQCQPTSHTLRLSVSGGGTADVPISPPTPVCEKGSMSFQS